MTLARGSSAVVVGAGLMGYWHARTLRRLGVPVSAVVDPDLPRVRKLAGEVGAPKAVGTLAEVLDSALVGPEVVHVCTPLETHGDLIRQALDARRHVLAEKPLTPGHQETRELLAEAGARELLLCPVHQFPFQRAFLAARGRLAGAGAVLHVDTVACSAGAAGRGAEAEGEIMAGILPHPLSLMRRLLGDDFADARWGTPVRRDGEFRAAGECRGASLGILISMRGRPTRNTLRIVCEGGTFHVDLFHDYCVAESPEVSRGRKILRPFSLAAGHLLAASVNLARRTAAREPAYPGLATLVARFHTAASEGGAPPLRPAEIMDVAVARDRLLGR